MNKSILSLCLLLVVSALCSCSDNISGGSTADKVMRGDTVSLALGESAYRESDGITVRFEAVPLENRCPIDAECYWAGMASARLRVSKPKHGALSATPSISGGGYDPRLAGEYDDSVLGYRVTLFSLTPYPQLSGTPDQSLYVATFGVFDQ